MKIIKIILLSSLLTLGLTSCNHKLKFKRDSKPTTSVRKVGAGKGAANNMSGGAMGGDATGVSSSGPSGALNNINN